MSSGGEPAQLTLDDVHKNWDDLLIGGNNGIMCIVFSLFWWGSALEKNQLEEYGCWERALKDVVATFGACLV
jgi:hypothetical protein